MHFRLFIVHCAFKFSICEIPKTVVRHLFLGNEVASVGGVLDSVSLAVDVFHVLCMSGSVWFVSCWCFIILLNLMSLTARATANIAAGYLWLASRCASLFLLSTKHAAYIALSSVLCEFYLVLPAAPWPFLLATSFAAAWSCFAAACAPSFLSPCCYGSIIYGSCWFVTVSWIRFIAAFSWGSTLGTACSCVGTLGSACLSVSTLGTDTCGVLDSTLNFGAVSSCSSLACFFSCSFIAFSIALSILYDSIPLLLIEIRPMAVLPSCQVTWCWATKDPSTQKQQHRSSILNAH